MNFAAWSAQDAGAVFVPIIVAVIGVVGVWLGRKVNTLGTQNTTQHEQGQALNEVRHEILMAEIRRIERKLDDHVMWEQGGAKYITVNDLEHMLDRLGLASDEVKR